MHFLFVFSRCASRVGSLPPKARLSEEEEEEEGDRMVRKVSFRITVPRNAVEVCAVFEILFYCTLFFLRAGRLT